MQLFSSIKKVIVTILTSHIAATLIKSVYGRYIPFFNVNIDVSDKVVSEREITHLFWRIYEKAEVRMIRKYYDGSMPVIELGSSIGVISSILGKMKKPEVPLFCIEANEQLIPTLTNNLLVNQVRNYQILHKAVGPKNATSVYFSFAPSSLNSKISKTSTDFRVDTINLIDFVEDQKLNDFFLICDIEGAEIFFINEQIEFLVHCKTAVIELHNISFEGKYYSRELLNELIQSRSNLRLLEKYRHVYVYQRK